MTAYEYWLRIDDMVDMALDWSAAKDDKEREYCLDLIMELEELIFLNAPEA